MKAGFYPVPLYKTNLLLKMSFFKMLNTFMKIILWSEKASLHNLDHFYLEFGLSFPA